MKRIRLKKRKKHYKLNLFFITFISIVICSFLVISNVSKKITPIISDLAEIKINKYSTSVINKAVSQVLEEKINVDQLFENVTSNDGTIEMIDFNPIVVNQVLSIATTVVLNNLMLLENGDLDSIGLDGAELSDKERVHLQDGIVAFIPIGSATNITLLSNLGPKIPVRLHYTGDVNSNITTKITPYGINNALIEIGVHLEVTAQVILPFSSSVKKLENDIPIAIKMIQGKIPSFYSGSILKNSDTFTLPSN